MQKEKAVHHYNLLEQFKATLESTVKLDGSNFETLFDSFGKLEKAIGFKIAQLLLDPIIKLFCKADEKLVDIFYDSYEEWKTNEQLDKDRQKACGVPGSKQSP